MLFASPSPRFSLMMMGNSYKIKYFVQNIVNEYPLEIHQPFAVFIFEEGIRPQHPVIHEKQIREQHLTLCEWFIDQAEADISMVHPAGPIGFEKLLDQIDRQISSSLLEYGTIAVKYDLYPSQYGAGGVKKIKNFQDVQIFKKHFLTEAVLKTEFEIITFIYYQLWGKLYAVKT